MTVEGFRVWTIVNRPYDPKSQKDLKMALSRGRIQLVTFGCFEAACE